MEKHLKKRILGAVVTVVAIAILLPIVIDGSRKRLTLNDDVPPMPQMPEWAEVENQKRIRIDLEKLASGDAQKHLTPPPMDTSPEDAPLPDQPVVQSTPSVTVSKPENRVKSAESAPVKPPVEQPPAVVAESPALDDNNLPYAWVVQLGAFAKEENARELRDMLRGKGIKSYVSTQIDGLTRVYAGPELKRSDAESLRQKLVLLLDSDSLPIKRYQAR